MTTPYPLQWPEHWPRTPANKRKRSSFKVTMGVARDDALAELGRLRASFVVMSTSIPVRRDGLFYATAREPDDPAVAVYFQWRGKPYVVACDTYTDVRSNVRAVGMTIEAMRSIERHGASQLLERAVSGFTALPPGSDEASEPELPWWEVLGIQNPFCGSEIAEVATDASHPMRSAMLAVVKTIYRQRIGSVHPDKAGSDADVVSLNLAYEAAREALE